MEIRKITTEAELKQVARLRYESYILERGFQVDGADHEQQLLFDPQDQTGHLFGAFINKNLIGTIRTSFLSENDDFFNYDAVEYKSMPVELQYGNVATTGRLIVAKPFRNTTVAMRLCCAVYQYGLDQGITHDVIICKPGLVSMYQKLGYRLHREKINHPEYGMISVLCLDLHDAEHLESTRSPLSRLLANQQPVLV